MKTLKRRSFLAALTLLLITVPAIAQGKTKAQQLRDLNRQMWLPFIEGINRDRPDLYVGVHSSDFRWIAPGNTGRIMDLEEYDQDSRSVMKRRKEAGEQTSVEFRFIERNVKGGVAAEKCVVKFVLQRKGKPPETSYGIAHYFSRNENGVWKMFLQYGSRDVATEAMFLQAAPVEDVARFASAQSQ